MERRQLKHCQIKQQPYKIPLDVLAQGLYTVLEGAMNRRVSPDKRLEFAFLRIKDVEDAFVECLGSEMTGEEIGLIVGFLALGFKNREGYEEDLLQETLGLQLEEIVCQQNSSYRYDASHTFYIDEPTSNTHREGGAFTWSPLKSQLHQRHPSQLEGQDFSTRQRDLAQNHSRSRLPTPNRVEVDILNSKNSSKCVSPTGTSFPKSIGSTFFTGDDPTPAQSQRHFETKIKIVQKNNSSALSEPQKVGNRSRPNIGMKESDLATKESLFPTQSSTESQHITSSKDDKQDPYMDFLQHKASGGFDFDQLLANSRLNSSNSGLVKATSKSQLESLASRKLASKGLKADEKPLVLQTGKQTYKSTNSEFTELLSSASKKAALARGGQDSLQAHQSDHFSRGLAPQSKHSNNSSTANHSALASLLSKYPAAVRDPTARPPTLLSTLPSVGSHQQQQPSSLSSKEELLEHWTGRKRPTPG